MEENILIIPRTDNTPRVELNPANNTYVIEGWSWPFDAISLYAPVIKWLNERGEKYMQNAIFQIRLAYFNTPSAKMLLEVLHCLETLANKGKNIEVKWTYALEEDKEEIVETFCNAVSLSYTFEQVKPDDVLLKAHRDKVSKNQYKSAYDKLLIEKCAKILYYVIENSLKNKKGEGADIHSIYNALDKEIPEDEIEYILNLFEKADGTFVSKQLLKGNVYGYKLNEHK